MKRHVCAQRDYCSCSNFIEPSDWCPLHGGLVWNRCACGRFVKVRPLSERTAENRGGK